MEAVAEWLMAADRLSAGDRDAEKDMRSVCERPLPVEE